MFIVSNCAHWFHGYKSCLHQTVSTYDSYCSFRQFSTAISKLLFPPSVSVGVCPTTKVSTYLAPNPLTTSKDVNNKSYEVCFMMGEKNAFSVIY